jgi:hypothetical protein
MKHQLGKGKLLGIALAMVAAYGVVSSATPAHAQKTKVVVIPMMESASGPLAPVPKTGAISIPGYTPVSGEDIDLHKGVSAPSPRFTDNNNGTVTDQLTGLIWLKDGNCTKFYESDNSTSNERDWAEAVTSANNLANGYCNLSDGSKTGEWRLPDRKELDSLIDLGHINPALPPDCPIAVTTVASYYWSSTTCAGDTYGAWYVGFDYGYGYDVGSKSYSLYVRAVRGGQ